MKIGDQASRTRTIEAEDIVLCTAMTARDHRRSRNEADLHDAHTTISNQDGTTLVEGTAVVYREPLPPGAGPAASARACN